MITKKFKDDLLFAVLAIASFFIGVGIALLIIALARALQ